MIYTVIVNKKSYDLPKKTIAIMERLDDVLRVDSIKNLSLTDKFNRLLEFLIDVLGEESVKEILGTLNLAEMDLSDITLTVRKIVDSYDKPINDFERQKTLESFNSLPLDKIVSLQNVIDKSKND